MVIDPNTANKYVITKELPTSYPKFTIFGAIMTNFNYETINKEFFSTTTKAVINEMKAIDLENVREQSVIRSYRDFFWHQCNIDPTKIRPAGEALLRRLLKQGKLPKIHPVVDAFNLISAKTGIPMCAYDLDKIEPPLVLRLSNANENFLGIGMKQSKQLEANIPIIVDQKSIISIYPYRDADHTKLSNKTQSVLITADGVPKINENLLKKTLSDAVSLIEEYTHGQSIGDFFKC
jgi:DNA/RNA-binding domain of Phe-tRNA-synthetase-like protein